MATSSSSSEDLLLSEDVVAAMSYRELQKACKNRGLKASGHTFALRERLLPFVTLAPPQQEEQEDDDEEALAQEESEEDPCPSIPSNSSDSSYAPSSSSSSRRTTKTKTSKSKKEAQSTKKGRRRRRTEDDDDDDEEFEEELYVKSTPRKQAKKSPSSSSSKARSKTSPKECPICLGDMKASSALSIECKHLFHSECLAAWMRQGHEQSMSCPSCRRPLESSILALASITSSRLQANVLVL